MMLPGHKTRIVCTIGPASRAPAVLARLVKAGMNVARLNFSHGSFEEHRKDIGSINRVAERLNHPVAVIADLPGPKIRIGNLSHEPLLLKRGDELTLTTRPGATGPERISVTYRRLPASVARGSRVYLNDGFIELRVVAVSASDVRCRVVVGGSLLSRKGLNLPGARLKVKAVTKSDLDCVAFALDQGVRIFGVSFVESGDDIARVRAFARARGKDVRLVAKIERGQAVRNLEDILKAADGVMVARGDLGVETAIADVAVVQKQIIRMANRMGKPVITATQMLESMVDNIRPTRAEVTDVANAILDGTDAVMLSEETAVGRYPVEAVRMMAGIASSTEKHRRDFAAGYEGAGPAGGRIDEDAPAADVISRAAVDAARNLKARFILVPTHFGTTPRQISRFKPASWVLAFTERDEARGFLLLSYGVYPIRMSLHDRDWYEAAAAFLKESRLSRPGDRLVVTENRFAGGGTDSIGVITVG